MPRDAASEGEERRSRRLTARVTGVDPSGSSLDRIAMCAPSAALPQIFDANDHDDPKSPKKKGTAVHSFLDRVAAVGRDAALAEVDEAHRDRCASINLAKLGARLTFSTEVALAYNWRDDTARRLTPVAPRLYEIDIESEVPVTLDLAAYDPDANKVYDGDYKGPRAWLPKPSDSMQLAVGALSLARIHGADEAEVEYIRILDDGEPLRFGSTLDVFGLESVADRIRSTMGLVAKTRELVDAGGTPNVTEGPWCRYCPARQHCPAKTAGMRALLVGDNRITLRDPVTPENAATFYAKVKAAEEMLAHAKSALYSYAKTTPIPVRVEEDGTIRMFGEWRRPGAEVLDGAKAHLAITEIVGPEAANKAVTMEVTKSAIGDVARAKALETGETIKAETAKILDRIKELGGVSNRDTCTTTEYTISPDGAAKMKKRKAA